MLNFKFTIQPEFKKVGNAFGNLGLREILQNIISEFAFLIERYAKQVTPVDTGRLRASIHTQVSWGSGIKSLVQTGTHYDIYVHEGTRKMRARPFMAWGTELALGKLTGQDIAWRLDKELVSKLTRL